MSLPIWSYEYEPAYQLMLKANDRWDKGKYKSGDKKFLKACAIIYKHYDQDQDPWYDKRSPVSELVKWSIDPCYKERVIELHDQTKFAYDGYHY